MTTDDPLAARAFDPLPLGDITPRGWLARQLETQADNITGPLADEWPSLADNRWLGGAHDGWERGPYYADGLVPLAFLLDDDDLIAAAERWVEGFLAHRHDDGWLGPVDQDVDQALGRGTPRDPWPRFVVLKVLRQYADATGDDRAVDAMTDFCDHLAHALAHRDLESWARYRWQDLATSVHWLVDRTGDDRFRTLAARASSQGYDWPAHFADFEYDAPAPAGEREMETHGVNNAMGVKAFAVRYRETGDAAWRDAAHDALATLDRCHGQATGVFSGDEHLAGRHPSRGTELCTVVEFMHSLETLAATFGDVAFADRLERVAFNALPAAFTPGMRGHQYDQQPNQVVCSHADRPWTNGPEANLFGIAPHYGCCTANLHQGWPKYAASLWMRAGDGLAAVSYAPADVETTVGADDVPVAVRVDTTYPFGDRVTISVDPAEPVAFPLRLRVPGWTEGATVTRPDGDGTTDTLAAGQYVTLDREWTPGDELDLDLAAPVTAERRFHGAVSLVRGPLVFARSPGADRRRVGDRHGRPLEAAYPADAWNYALDVDPAAPEAAVDVTFADPGTPPFDPDAPPATLSVRGRRVPDWHLDQAAHWAAAVPASPAPTTTPTETLSLVPYGCTTLRVTEFPLAAPPAAADQ